MSLKQNILSGYFAQVYTAVIGIVMAPVYMRYIGVEANGLVGFFAILQAWVAAYGHGADVDAIKRTVTVSRR